MANKIPNDEEKTIKKDKGLMWYFYPNEMVRIMRTHIFSNIDINLDLTPSYTNVIKKDIDVGVVIGTYGSIPYIDLSLHHLKYTNGIKNILVHDDCSPEKDKLKKLCEKYSDNTCKVDFYSTPKNLWHKSNVGSIGDQNCFYEGLKWAKQKKLDIMVKFSRRFIPCYNWINDFKNLVLESDGITFGSFCTKDNFPLRTECLGLNVNAWNIPFVLNLMNWHIKNEFSVFSEFWMNELAQELDVLNNSAKYEKYKKEHKHPYKKNGYIHWYDILGTCRYNKENRKNEKILWHMTDNEREYYNEAVKCIGNKYNIKDFFNITNI